MPRGKGSSVNRLVGMLEKISDQKPKAIAALHKLKQQRARIDRQIELLSQYLGHETTTDALIRSGKKAIKAGKKRMKRTTEECQKYAAGIVKWIKAKGEASGQEIRKRFPDIGQSAIAFIRKHSKTDVKVKGVKRAARYSV